MNTKRQTIWLVSMLGLMVVLSAYYLFTDDVNNMDVVSEDDLQGTMINAIEVDEHSELPGLDELVAAQDSLVGMDNSSSMVMEDDAGDVESKAQENEQILQKVQAGARNGEEFIAALEMERTAQLTRETDDLFKVIADPKRTPEEVAKAEERLQKIEEIQAKVGDLEDQLMREYENVIITEAGGKFNVVVKTAKLPKSEVVKIIDMVMQELQVGANKITVEYVT